MACSYPVDKNEGMRCDLHIHSTASGMCNTRLLERVCRESYNQPDEVYARCKELGMSIVTLTDHDSIDGAERLRRHPDFFVSEEVTCRMPSGTEVHIGVYNLTERDLTRLQIGQVLIIPVNGCGLATEEPSPTPTISRQPRRLRRSQLRFRAKRRTSVLWPPPWGGWA